MSAFMLFALSVFGRISAFIYGCYNCYIYTFRRQLFLLCKTRCKSA